MKVRERSDPHDRESQRQAGHALAVLRKFYRRAPLVRLLPFLKPGFFPRKEGPEDGAQGVDLLPPQRREPPLGRLQQDSAGCLAGGRTPATLLWEHPSLWGCWLRRRRAPRRRHRRHWVRRSLWEVPTCCPSRRPHSTAAAATTVITAARHHRRRRCRRHRHRRCHRNFTTAAPVDVAAAAATAATAFAAGCPGARLLYPE